MANQPIYASGAGPRLTVSQMLKSPALIPRRILDMTQNEFFVDQLLRPGPPIPTGVVMYHESDPLYMDDAIEVVSEFGDIPLGGESTGAPQYTKSVKRALGFRVSDEMVRRDNTDDVARRMQKVKNTFAAAYESLFLAALVGNASIPTATKSGNYWNATTASTAGAGILYDVPQVKYNIRNADADSSNGTGIQKFGFNANTIVLNDIMATNLLNNPDLTKVLQVGNVADQQGVLTGKFDQTFLNLRVITSWRLDPDVAIFMESGTVGFISDEVPLNATPMQRFERNQSWESYVTRASAVGIDQPKAAFILKGINGGSHSIQNYSSF